MIINSMLLPARYGGRGTISKRGTKQKSQLAQRIADEFGEQEIELTYQSKKSGTALRPVVTISKQKEHANDGWVSSYSRGIPVPKESDRVPTLGCCSLA